MVETAEWQSKAFLLTDCLVLGWRLLWRPVREQFPNLGHETKTSSMHCPDCHLMMTIVSHRLSRRPDAAGNAGVRHTLPEPDLLDDLVLGHHSVVMTY